AVVPEGLNENIINSITEIGYSIREVSKTGDYWLWDATGLKSVMSIGEGLANMGQGEESMQVHQNLVITMTNPTIEGANDELSSMKILLRSGSLPLHVESIDKDVISPELGRDFLANALLAGLAAIFAVAAVLFIRYRRIIIAIPMMFTALSEVVIIMGFAALTGWNLDLAAIAGIIAAVGTGVDDQIVITDELLRGEKKTGRRSIVGKIKSAFFIIFAAASTTIAAMFPIIFIGLGMGKLVGFATVTIFGVLAGVFVTRPAFAEIMKMIVYKEISENQKEVIEDDK
ncbi:MAG: preprotein translocase subunit SecD, partial [Candidatus Diapherotrites archaeon]|nr:preprotein translocase subunit SecD [Candidatus Diapherotrites archaeon]